MLERFMTKVVIRPGSRCWIWTGARARKGYGHFAAAGGHVERAHRVSYRMHIGPLPADLHVLHACDNPSCVNPEHLSRGTNQENRTDSGQKGRHNFGSFNGCAKLDEFKVAEIKALLAQRTETQRAIANRYGVTGSVVSNINTGRLWSHV